ncbi:hypothetical protein GCM10010430_66800 [Kitasatospora cystarginea]|uniref:Uncharacterized protein n=1 Tax=Kitasatospora cystarginea TaxID=58350 RepID=A0ABN3EUR5_9ACTN
MNADTAQAPSLNLAEGLLRAEFRKSVLADPDRALGLVGRFALAMHAEALAASDSARMAGVDFESRWCGRPGHR